MTPADAILMAVTPVYLGAAFCDVAARIIPDRAPVALLAVGVGVALLAGPGLPWGALGAGLAVFIGLAVVAGGALGGGDIKLAAASAVLLGAGRTPDLLLLTALAGGVLAAGYLMARAVLRRLPAQRCPMPGKATGRWRHRCAVVLAAERRRIRRGAGLPYGVAIATAALTLLAQPS
ncbi:prepilin peptidase [Azospirillum sp. TSO22-1]|uniref:prepilin peptidase n=1 Tax=Azospirillum sp. TSO22-1 TaxID=716789 RepID=UPI000D6539BD|nr:prepilin peptidase [Azospirillum sp. TSO22-1]